MIDPGPYVTNAVAMLSSLVDTTEPVPGVMRAQLPHVTRFIVTKETPSAILCQILDEETGAVTLEDSFGATPIEQHRATLKHMPVMIRRPAPITPTLAAEKTNDYETVKAIVREGFPARGVYPPSIVDNPAWTQWIAYHQGDPAAAMYTFDDGENSGVYLLATLPKFRGLGLGRALMTHAIAATPARGTVLVATTAGQPLYESLGFTTIGRAIWYSRI